MPHITMFKPAQLAPLEPTKPRVMRITTLKDGCDLVSRYVTSVRDKGKEQIELH